MRHERDHWVRLRSGTLAVCVCETPDRHGSRLETPRVDLSTAEMVRLVQFKEAWAHGEDR